MPADAIDRAARSQAERKERLARTADGAIAVEVYDAVRLTVQGRDCTTEVTRLADDSPVTIGRIALLMLDFVVDPATERLIGNPEHDGEWIVEIFATHSLA